MHLSFIDRIIEDRVTIEPSVRKAALTFNIKLVGAAAASHLYSNNSNPRKTCQ